MKCHNYYEFACGKPVRVRHCEHLYCRSNPWGADARLCGIKEEENLNNYSCHHRDSHLLRNCVLIQQQIARGKRKAKEATEEMEGK